MALMQITIVPLGVSSTSLGGYVADILKELKKENIPYQLTDMGTIVEGEADTLFSLAARLHKIPFQKGAQRVSTQISIDDRKDKKVTLGDKVQSVFNRLDT